CSPQATSADAAPTPRANAARARDLALMRAPPSWGFSPEDADAQGRRVLEQLGVHGDVVLRVDVQAARARDGPGGAERAAIPPDLRPPHAVGRARDAADPRVELALGVAELVEPARAQLGQEQEVLGEGVAAVHAHADAAHHRVDLLLVGVDRERPR